MPDLNMHTAYIWANEWCPTPPLELAVENVDERAELVDRIGEVLVPDNQQLHKLPQNEKIQRLNAISILMKEKFPNEKIINKRISFALRLWSGCISATKTIALETMDGLNTPEMRRRIFEEIEPIAQRDPIFMAGVEAATAPKRRHNQCYSFLGVPESSCVRRYP